MTTLTLPVFLGQNDIPERKVLKEWLIRFLFWEEAYSVNIRDDSCGWTLEHEVANQFRLSQAARDRQIRSGRTALRAAIGFARKDLVDEGLIEPTVEGEEGIWRLTCRGIEEGRRLTEE